MLDTNEIELSDSDKQNCFPEYISSVPYDLRRLSSDNIKPSKILEYHRRYKKLNNIRKIKNISDSRSFIKESEKKWSDGRRAYYILTKNAEFFGYLSVYEISWKQNTATIRLYIKSNDQELVNNSLNMILYATFKVIGVSIINIKSFSNKEKTSEIQTFVENSGGSFDGRERVPSRNLNTFIDDLSWSISNEEFYSKDSEYTDFGKEE
jgi:hypothetical protein